jgi:uncharacterized protein
MKLPAKQIRNNLPRRFLNARILRGFKAIFCMVFVDLFIAHNFLVAQSGKGLLAKDELYPSTEVFLTGYLAQKLNESLNNRILAQNVDQLIEPFRPENRTETRLWQSEFWGKWFTSAVLAYKYSPDPRLKKVLDYAVSGLLATQTPDGYIGNYAKSHRLEEWDIWGRKYCMLGLLAYYDLTGDQKSLIGASRMADNLISELGKKDGMIVTKGNYRGMAASSVLQPICLLYQYTQNRKYLDFAMPIVRQWETPLGPQLISKANINVAERFPKPKSWYSPEQGQKAYEMMSCYEGLIELYRLTGNPSYKKAVEETWENIRNTEINIAGSGASAEMWFGGKSHQSTPVFHYQETCVTVTWLKLSEQLLVLTGQAKYAEEVERTYYNALLGSMSTHGSTWAKYTPLEGQRLPGSEQCGMGLNCCVANGPRGLFALPNQMIMERKEGLQVNYFADGTFILKTPLREKITLIQQTDYPKSGLVNIVLNLQKPEGFEIRVRIPEWSKKSKLSINGIQVGDVQPGQYTGVKRSWKTGDKISLDLDMSGRTVETGTSPRSIALMRGPIVLARDSRFDGVAIEATLKPVADRNGNIELIEVPPKTTDDVWLLFKANFIPESYTENPKGPISVMLCDYASAGNDSENSFFKVWMPQIFNPRPDE